MTQARERYRPERDKTSKLGIIIDYNMDPLFSPYVFVAVYYIAGLICMIVYFVLPSDGESTQPVDYGSQISLGGAARSTFRFRKTWLRLSTYTTGSAISTRIIGASCGRST